MFKSPQPRLCISSVIFEEKNSSIASANTLAQKDTTERAQFVVHLTDSTCRTIEYHTFDGPQNPGKIRITSTSFKFMLTIKAIKFQTKDGKGYEYSKFETWLKKDAKYDNTPLVQGKHDQDEFVKHCIAHLEMNGQRPDFTEKASLVIKLTLRTPSSKDNEMFLKTKNDLQATIRRLKKTDETHATSVAAKLPLNISVFKVIQVASHQVSYGVFHFAKILVGNEVYVHVRIHEYFDGNLQYHSIDTTRDTASWGKADPLVYFDF